MKRCSKCGEMLAAEMFSRDRRHKDGRTSQCKACIYAYRKTWIAANRDKHNAASRRHYARNAEGRRAQRRAYYAANTEREREANAKRRATPEFKAKAARQYAQWSAANPAKVRDKAKRWQQENLDRARAATRRRRAQKRAAFVEHVDELILLERDDGMCGICGEDVDPRSFHIDHIRPLARGGEHSYANTQVAHAACNIAKSDRLPSEVEA